MLHGRLDYELPNWRFCRRLLFDDIGCWGGIWHNWGYFGQPFSMLAAVYFTAHFWIHFENPNGALRHKSGIMFSLNHANTPLVWPHTKFEVAADENWAAVLVSNTIYAYFNLYYIIKWKASILKPKTKLPNAEKLMEMQIETQNITEEEQRKAEELEERMNSMNARPQTEYDKRVASQFSAYV